MLKKLAYMYGALFLLLGVLGFVPGVTTDNQLFGVFHVSTLHNIIHIATGVAAFALVAAGRNATRSYFQAVGVIYGLVTVIGFIQGVTVLGVLDVNHADNWLHLVLSAVALYAGFGTMPVRNEQ